MLVWQDAVSMYWEKPYWEGERYRTPLEKTQFEAELHRMVEVRGSTLSISEARRVSFATVFFLLRMSRASGSRRGGFKTNSTRLLEARG